METSSKQISLKTVLEATPAEAKAETKVIHSLERDVETGGGLVDAEEAHVFQQATTERQDVEEDLFHLTNAMKAKSTWSSLDAKTEQDPDEQVQQAGKSHDGFLTRNATRLVHRAKNREKVLQEKTREAFEQSKLFFDERKSSAWLYTRTLLIYWIFPFLGLAALLFQTMETPKDEQEASTSWWILFVFVRQPITLAFAKATQAILIDFACVRTRIAMWCFGPFVTLMLMQSKGWPFQMLAWGLWDFSLLYGNHAFARHWMHGQELFDVFTSENQAGRVTDADKWLQLLVCAVVVGSLVALKRVSLGLWYSRAVYRRYGADLSKVMRRALLIGEVAANGDHSTLSGISFDTDIFRDESHKSDMNDDNHSSNLLIDSNRKDALSGGLTHSQRINIQLLLGDWEEPSTEEQMVNELISISAVVQFQAAVSCISRAYPFTDTNTDILKFEKLVSRAAVRADGSLDKVKLKDLVSVFRPARNGEITLLEFVKSIDVVYKDLRVIRASITNARKMNAASQRIVDVIVNFILVLIALAILGIDALALIGGMVGIVISFAFMIGGASSKYFEGLLLVLVRKPFDIGDRIAVSDVNDEVSPLGSSGWVVKDLDLFTTTVVFGASAEEATYSNGSLAASRIINHNRSPKAVLNFVTRFGIDVEKDKVTRFGKAVEQFVKDRPREWLTFVAFRLSDVQPDRGFVEYKVIMQHRESWQQIGALLTSKAAVQLFAYELSKEMKMGYENPAMPIILTSRAGGDQGNEATSELIGRSLKASF